MVKKILLGSVAVLVLLVVVLAIVVALQPSAFAITRAATINAPASVVFAQVDDFHNWEAWSPWAKRDPHMKSTYSGPERGEGASYGWAGNDEVGEGRMTITESDPSERILIDLEFLKPFPARDLTEFTFAPVEGRPDRSKVTWTMSGENNFMGKAFCLFMDMDAMVGGDFEKGLASMGAAAEADAESAVTAE